MGISVWVEVAGADQDVELFLAYVRVQMPDMRAAPTVRSSGAAGRRHHTIRFTAPDTAGVTLRGIETWLRHCYLPRARVSLMPVPD